MLSPAHAGVADTYLADLEASVREVRGSGESGGEREGELRMSKTARVQA